MAEFIAALTEPPVTVPTKLAALLDNTILLRQSYSEDIAEFSANAADEDSSNRHAFFLGILKKVRVVLSPLITGPPAAIKEKANSTSVSEILNVFEHLELEEPSAAFEQAPDAPTAPAPIYKAERPNDVEEDFFMLHLLLHDLARLRTEVSRAWEGYKQGGHDLIAASITTNTAVDLARSMIEDSKSAFAKHGGAIRMLQVYYAAQCLEQGSSEAQKQRPTDDMNFAMFSLADAVFWPAFLLLDGFASMHKINPHPEMKPGFYGTYNPSSDRARKSSREKFLEDKILLLEVLTEFYFYCHMTKASPPPVEDEFICLLRNMFETKEVTLPLVFAATLFLDIHHILRDKADDGFTRLTDAAHFVTVDIEEEIKFHEDVEMATWPKQNDHTMQHFVETVKFWVHQDQQRKVGLQLKRTYPPKPWHLYRKHSWSCGLWRYWVLMQFHEFGIVFANAWGSIMSCAHLYNAVSGGKTQDMMWKDLDVVTGLQDPKTFFVGEAPTTPDECLKRFALAMGASATNLAKSTRTRRGLVHSKKGPKGLKELGATMQAFKSRICDANGPKNIRAEDVQKILDNSSWDYELDDNDNAQQVFKDVGEAPRRSRAKEMSVSKCVGLVRDLLHAEVIEISFDYFRLHRQCWRLLGAVKDHVREDLIRIYGPDYMQRESELPFIVGYVLMASSQSQELGELLKPKLPGVQVTSRVQEGARYVLEGLIASGAGGLIVEQILPRALNMQIDFEFEI
ncbi:hypothetical protein E8E13_000745 [Curvularia kusanoi]|uniref:DUF6604 domain-containing protein n=1 Tax=Curvularia kusanoi TaxID=90978 RepID=A0A9P4T400_CURKU|nr:hypothetical protein E8E13_000745 [Curvularia kusanoi]